MRYEIRNMLSNLTIITKENFRVFFVLKINAFSHFKWACTKVNYSTLLI